MSTLVTSQWNCHSLFSDGLSDVWWDSGGSSLPLITITSAAPVLPRLPPQTLHYDRLSDFSLLGSYIWHFVRHHVLGAGDVRRGCWECCYFYYEVYGANSASAFRMFSVDLLKRIICSNAMICNSYTNAFGGTFSAMIKSNVYRFFF